MLKKLLNPVALAFQGFVVGGLFFWAAQGDASPRMEAPIAAASSLSTLN